MSKLKLELCPETGICSIIKADGKKIDLMPDEVAAVRGAAKNPESVRATLAEIDADFAVNLDLAEIAQVSGRLK